MGTEIPGVQLHESQATEEALGAESGGTIQGASPGTYVADPGHNLVRMVQDLAEYLRGWIGYFGRCETPEVLDKLEKWLRRRLRSMVWKQWKPGTTRYRELRKRGIAAQEAAQTAGSSDGPWHLAKTPALNIALPNAYFVSLGLPELTVHG